jgi:hypothetical protein
MIKSTLQLLAVSAVLVPLVTAPAGSAELIMLEQDGCAWCIRWDEEIGGIYPKTAESKLAPLRRVDIDEPWPDDLKTIRRDQFTPTFVLVDDGSEVGRMRGYVGDEFFWVLLGEMLEKLPNSKTN